MNRKRVAGLDGLRGLCALYVMLFHCWAYTFRGFPRYRGPDWLSWLGFGRLSVVLFLVLSGFSLALAAAGDDWRLGSLVRYARRRAWRILPAYWAALAFSLVIAWTVVRQPYSPEPTAGSVVVYTLLLQDLVAVPTPNGAFWSIGVEVLLYGVLPLLLILCRRLGPAAMLAVVTLPVLVIGFMVFDGSPPQGDNLLTPHLVPAFAAGVAAAGVAAAGARRLPWAALSLLAAIPAGALVLHQGSRWMVHHYYWVDLAVVPAMTLFLLAVVSGRPPALIRLLDSAPLRRLGSFSYSLYLIHLPIVVAIDQKVVAPRLGHGIVAFTATTVLAGGLSLIGAWCFAKLFEVPFRSWADVRNAIRPGVRAGAPITDAIEAPAGLSDPGAARSGPSPHRSPVRSW
ncbi:acyltransferase family protein [Actinoplanes ianthinogenes]|uniref:acyltransferase family protein n=1 Tax=Actinoplanes ianthinogenes TaxID=122358 RepID=UPI001BB3684B|nr:acyltransferase [Actinoplanes ianthinogenes]